MNENMRRTGTISLKAFGGVLVALMLSLLFFSKTIYTYGLPTVTCALPHNGRLTKTVTASGTADWADTVEMYAALGGKVSAVLVEEGDRVKAGTPIVQLWFDEDGERSKLKEIEVSRKKLAVDIETIGLKEEKTKRIIAELEQEVYEKDPLSAYELEKLETNIARAEEEHGRLKSLYEAGGIPQQELETKAYEIAAMKSEYENIINIRFENDRKADKEIAEKEKEREKKINDYRHELLGFGQERKAKELELSNLAIQEEGCQKNLKDYAESKTITAAVDGLLISLPVKAGQMVNTGQLAASIGAGTTYALSCEVPENNNSIAVGDVCTLTNSSHALEGVVTKITPEAGRKLVTVEAVSDEVTTGETFSVEFTKESVEDYALVPNGAVNKDSNGYFLYKIKTRKGVLGEEYYAEKTSVYIGDSDDENTVITKGLGFYEPIVILSDKSFSDGGTVQVANVGDFFAE